MLIIFKNALMVTMSKEIFMEIRSKEVIIKLMSIKIWKDSVKDFNFVLISNFTIIMDWIT